MSAAVALGVVGGLQLYSGYRQSQMIMDQARLTNKINDANAKFIEMDAWEAERMGFSESARYQSVIDKTIGEQKVAFTEQNVDLTFGTVKDVQDQTKLTGFLNTLDIQTQARNKALGLKFQASNLRLGGQMGLSQASMNAYGALMGGITQGAATGISAYSKK